MRGRIRLVLLFLVFLSGCTGYLQRAAETNFHLDDLALAYGVFETEASSVMIDVYSTAPVEFSVFADISVEDGTGVTTYKVQSGKSMIVHSLPPGRKQVTITSGGRAKLNDEMTGVFIQKITFDGPTTQIDTPGKRVVVYGDSIAVGGNVDHPSAEAWPVLLRKHYSVMVEAYAYRTLYDDAPTPAKSSDFAARISAGRPDFVWLAIGTNDYGFSQWSAREFGEAYAGTLDAVHAATPRALVFAQSPIRRADESRNSVGSNLEDYRRQIASACSQREPWCIFVDGKSPSFPQPDELDKDGIHLTTVSSMKYAGVVLAVINESQ